MSDQGPKAGGALDRDKSPARGGGAIPLNPEDRAAPEGSAIDHLTVGQGNEMAATLIGDERAFQQIQDGKEALRVTGEVLDAGVRFNPAVGIAEDVQQGKLVKAGLETALAVGAGGKLLEAASGAIKGLRAARSGTEVVQRAMSRAELDYLRANGTIRFGKAGTELDPHFVSDAVNSDLMRARLRLALPQAKDVRVTLEVEAGAFSQPRTVQPLDLGNGRILPGGGTERTATGVVRARILGVDEF